MYVIIYLLVLFTVFSTLDSWILQNSIFLVTAAEFLGSTSMAGETGGTGRNLPSPGPINFISWVPGGTRGT